MRDFKPAQDCYKDYTKGIEEAIKDGKFEDYEAAQDSIWPWELHLADSEKEDLNDLLLEITKEVISQSKSKGLTPKIVASYIFKSIITGMLLQEQRIGR